MLQLVTNQAAEKKIYPVDEVLSDHYGLIEGFIKSHKIRNLAESTVKKEKYFLVEWFEEQGFQGRPLYVWEAMEQNSGRKIIVDYGQSLLQSEITTHTIRSYLGILRRFFSYVLEHPLIMISPTQAVRIQDKYGVLLSQPVSEFDMPRYVYEGERMGLPMDPENLYEFYSVLRENYLGRRSEPIKERNYAMAVLAGESGLRVNELLHLEVDKDLFFESKKLQTREAKAAKGSGKRSRVTLFTPLARDTLKFYIGHGRRSLVLSSTPWVFPSKTGKKLAYASAQSALKEMIKVARANNFSVSMDLSWHWFRRFFATRFIERFPGKTAVLLELLGHMSPNTVHRYIRHSKAWIDGQIQAVLEGAETWPYIGN